MKFRAARFINGIVQVDAAAWNSLVGAAAPFLRHEFLLALERSGCVVPHTGWTPMHVLIEDTDGRLAGAMPMYAKAHSRGEFVFDFSWANAYAQHGLAYYPKLLTAVPFTPVCGPRLMVGPTQDRSIVKRLLINAARDLARGERLSSWHVLFPDEGCAEEFIANGMIVRRDCQFHWYNRGYDSFEAFLATFTAEKRKKAKRERRRVAEAGIEFDTLHGGDMHDALWETVYAFYADTFYRHGHEPYLNLDFFKIVTASMPDRLMLKLARIGSQPIAVAIFFIGEDALYGRYWGSRDTYHSLHFETCYYQGIDYCITHRLARFEPGTQGEHKVPRGFVPTMMSSAHFVVDSRFDAAIRQFAAREARGVEQYAAAVGEHVPYHRAADEGLQL